MELLQRMRAYGKDRFSSAVGLEKVTDEQYQAGSRAVQPCQLPPALHPSHRAPVLAIILVSNLVIALDILIMITALPEID